MHILPAQLRFAAHRIFSTAALRCSFTEQTALLPAAPTHVTGESL